MSRSPSMHIRLPERLWLRVRLHMEQTGLSKQEAVRALLKLGLEHYEATSARS